MPRVFEEFESRRGRWSQRRAYPCERAAGRLSIDITELCPELPILMSSGFVSEELRAEAVKAGGAPRPPQGEQQRGAAVAGGAGAVRRCAVARLSGGRPGGARARCAPSRPAGSAPRRPRRRPARQPQQGPVAADQPGAAVLQREVDELLVVRIGAGQRAARRLERLEPRVRPGRRRRALGRRPSARGTACSTCSNSAHARRRQPRAGGRPRAPRQLAAAGSRNTSQSSTMLVSSTALGGGIGPADSCG